ncbi:ribosomal protein L31 isoform X2 [Carex rostrata]
MALLLKSSFMSTAIVNPSRRSPSRLSLPTRPIRVDCRKQGLHPTYFEDTKVYCDGQLIMVTGGTQKELTVDTWSGNHAFYLGQNMSGDDEDFFGNDQLILYDDEGAYIEVEVDVEEGDDGTEGNNA